MNSFYSEEDLQEIGFKQLGKHVLISRKASIYSPNEISIGNRVRVDDFCILSGAITLENNIHIAAYSSLYAGSYKIEIQDFCNISSRCVIYALSDDYYGEGMTNPMVPEKYRKVVGGKVVLEKHVIVGTGSTILPNVTLKEGASIGCMSLVNRTLEGWNVYAGIPCKKINIRSRKLLELEKKYKESQEYFD